MIESCNFTDDEVQRVHLPFFYYTLSSIMSRCHQNSSLKECLDLALKLASTISETVFMNSWNLSEFRGSSQEEIVKSAIVGSPLLESPVSATTALAGISVHDISLIYNSQDSSNEQSKRKLFQRTIVGKPILEDAFWNITTLVCLYEGTVPDNTLAFASPVPNTWKLLCDLIERHIPFYAQVSWISSKWFQVLKNACFVENFKVASTAMSTVLDIAIAVKWSQDVEFCNRCFSKLWSSVDSADVKSHSKIVALLVKLGSLYNPVHIEQSISIEIKKTAKELDKFGIIWKYLEQGRMPGFTMDMPLCTVFNYLLDENESQFYTAKSWIYNYVSNFACTKMIHPLLSILGHPDIVFKVTASSNDALTVLVRRLYNQSQVLYAIDVFEKLVSFGSQIGFLEVIAETDCPKSFSPSFVNPSLADLKMIDAMILEILMFALAKSNFKDKVMGELQQIVRRKAVKFLNSIFGSCSRKMISKVSCSIAYQSMLLALQTETIVPIQVELLSAIRAISNHLFELIPFESLYPDSGIFNHHLKISN